MREVKLFINGEYIESSSHTLFEVKNPATQEIIAKVHEASFEDVDCACEAARQVSKKGLGEQRLYLNVVPSFHVVSIKGKFQGVINAATPTVHSAYNLNTHHPLGIPRRPHVP